MRRYQISFAGHNPGRAVRTGCSWGEERRKKNTRGKGEDKAVFKRVLTPRQGCSGPHGGEARRAPRITAPRVSRNPGLYAAVVLGRRAPPILSLTALTSSPESACPTGPSSSEADATDVRARRTRRGLVRGPPQNEFQQVETRAGGPRPRHAHIVQVPSRGFPLTSPLFLPSASLRQLRASLFQRDLLSSATRES